LLTKNYFLTESTTFLVVSLIAAAEVSTVVLVESFIVVTLSVLTVVESVVVVELAEPLQAAKAPIAKTANSFFIVICLIMNDFLLIQRIKKSNLISLEKSPIIFSLVYK
jgi:hypothetical protein